ncbi:hypothetical protein NE237_018964 [Protea cynaroides]|uniref:Uncharacterized protein n=1 Tax=Protea cynaroides TaxID=273540 RepID=A0A9Q0KAZ6_9MAGN|nr:hypothetical protein NE237_018964 [Protea cynaroides]
MSTSSGSLNCSIPVGVQVDQLEPSEVEDVVNPKVAKIGSVDDVDPKAMNSDSVVQHLAPSNELACNPCIEMVGLEKRPGRRKRGKISSSKPPLIQVSDVLIFPSHNQFSSLILWKVLTSSIPLLLSLLS